MRLHENNALFRDAILVTAQQMNIQPEFIEKDYWLTYALHLIFHDDIGNETVFKGGKLPYPNASDSLNAFQKI
jgi:hypothetical protein